MSLFAHHEILIAVEYSLFAGGGTIWAISQWWKRRNPSTSKSK